MRLPAQSRRVAREVAPQAGWAAQANVLGVAGTWKDLTESVTRWQSNFDSLGSQHRGVTTAVGHGDLSEEKSRWTSPRRIH